MGHQAKRVISYRRVSTEEQSDSGKGLDAQAASIAAAATIGGWEIVAELTDAGISGAVAPEKRPALAEALAMVSAGEADAIAVAKLDRATRSVADLLNIIDRSNDEGWAFIALDIGVDSSTPTGRMVSTIIGSVAEYERILIGTRTSEALQAAKRKGSRLGRPVTLDQSTRERIVSERESGRTLTAISDDLNSEGVPTARGGRWYPTTVSKIVKSVMLDREAAEAAQAA